MCCGGLIEKLPQLDTCCCCCKVSTGSKIIAWLGAIGSLLYAVEMIVAAINLMKGKESPGGAIAAIIIVMVVVTFFCIMAFVLLVGLYQEDMGKVNLWLRVSVCMFITLVVVVIASIISLAVSGAGTAIIGSAISAVISILFQLYMISIVKSHYHNMTGSYDSGRA